MMSPRTVFFIQTAVLAVVLISVLGTLLLPTIDTADLGVAAVAFTVGICARFLADIVLHRHRDVRTARY